MGKIMCWASNVGKKACSYISFGENPQDKTKEIKGKGNWINCLKCLGCVPKNLQNLNFWEEQNYRVHPEWQWPLSGVHSIRMVNLAQPCEGGGCTPYPFHSIYHHEQSCGLLSSWEGRYIPPISPLLLYVDILHEQNPSSLGSTCKQNWGKENCKQ
jgi:hypothetical protein